MLLGWKNLMVLMIDGVAEFHQACHNLVLRMVHLMVLNCLSDGQKFLEGSVL